MLYIKKNGEKVWISEKHHPSKRCYDSDEGGYATPILYDYAGKRCALIYNCTGLYAVEVITGERLWYYEWFHYEVADPIIFDNKVFISTGAGNAQCILLDITGKAPKVLWQNKNMRNHFSTCVYVDGYIYGSDGYVGGLRPFRCIDMKTGEIMWEKKMTMASHISVDGKLIILEEDGTLHIAEATPSAYQEMSSCDVLEGEQRGSKFWTPPVLCNGKIYCRNYAGDLVCIDVSK